MFFIRTETVIHRHLVDNPCYNPICQNRGVCSVVYNSSSVSYTCTCPSFYTGQHCETPLRAQMNDACSTPCKNGGTCKSGLCLCPSQYMGSFCEYGQYDRGRMERNKAKLFVARQSLRESEPVSERWYLLWSVRQQWNIINAVQLSTRIYRTCL